MKFEDNKKLKKYLWVGIAVVGVLLLVFVLISLNNMFSSDFGVKGSLSAKLEDKVIKSNETTYLLVGAKNTGESILEAEFRVSADDKDAVKINHDKLGLLKFELLPQESVVRRLSVTGFSKAIRTDYEINVEIVGNNETVLDSEEIVLTVKK